MKTENRGIVRSVLIGSLLILVPMFLLSAWAWQKLPEGSAMPVHWNAAGQIDRYGSKSEGLLLVPIISTGLAILLAFIPLFEPRGANLARSAKAYSIACMGTLLMMLVVQTGIVLTTLGRTFPMTMIAFCATGLLFVVIGNYMGKIRSNHFFGIRTPWTLSSEVSWNKTHRLGGRLFMLIGVLLTVTSLLFSETTTIAAWIGGTLFILVFSLGYSYIAWKSDPDKQPIGRMRDAA